MKILKQLVKRNIAGDVILVPVGDASLELKGLLTLNETGEWLWDHLEACDTPEALTDAMLAEFDAEREMVSRDVADFLERLRQLHIVE